MSVFKSTVLITGGTVNLGYEAALEIARLCPDRQIVLASRTDKDDAASTINKTLGQTNVAYLPLDLSDLENVRAFASQWPHRDFPPISALLLNAGLQFPGPVGFFPSGLEKTFAINHVGHALLFYLLAKHLTQDARIILTSSDTHDPSTKSGMPDATFPSAETVARPDPKTAPKDGRTRYTTSKLANVLWMYALQRHVQASGKQWQVAAFNPSLMVGTGLAREYSPVLRFLWLHILPHAFRLMKLVFQPAWARTPQQSGKDLAVAAIKTPNVGGLYIDGDHAIDSSVLSRDEAKQEDLYSWTLKELARNERERREFETFKA
jgi:NAD(P)-dependent dehydrogenase (short-subunit alcohol dehydrogenase family)